MILVPQQRRFQAADVSDPQRFVTLLNAFANDVTSALQNLPPFVRRTLTVTTPAASIDVTPTVPWVGSISYRKDNGIVRLEGTVSGGLYDGTAIFTLPAAYRPPVARQFAVAQSSLFAPDGLVQVLATGEVVAPTVTSVQSGKSTLLSLDGIAFSASDPTAVALDVPLLVDVTGLSGKPTGVVVTACFDVTTGAAVPAPYPSIAWGMSGARVQITSLAGLAPERTYSVSVVVFA